MKITKETLRQIIKEELLNLKEYSPYGKGARPAVRAPKPGEKYKKGEKPDDPKRSRPPKRESVEGIAPDEPDDRTHGEYFADVNGLPQEPLAPSIDDAIDGYGKDAVMSAVGEHLMSLRKKTKDPVELAKALNQFIEDKFSDMQRFNKQFALGEEKKIPSLKQIIKEELENLKEGEQEDAELGKILTSMVNKFVSGPRPMTREEAIDAVRKVIKTKLDLMLR
jgi:hypothetical protein